MNRHLITVVILLASLALYLLGIKGWGLAFFITGAVLELWFWARLVSSRPPATGSEARHTN